MHTSESLPKKCRLEAPPLLERLKKATPLHVPQISSDLHALPPFLPRDDWNDLGDLVKAAENPDGWEIAGDKWISLRCDGNSFSKFTKGTFGKVYSPEFAEIMQVCCQQLMVRFAARCGYTQSDELTVLIAPTPVVRGERQAHAYKGRIQKLCSIAAATVTACFHDEFRKRNLKGTDALATFDCRVGSFDTEDQALAVILWRAYDCGVNGVSDAVFKNGGSKTTMLLQTNDKLLWLKEQGLLPLPRHQREGSFYCKVRRKQTGWNPKKKESVTFYRGKIETVEGNVLQLFHDGKLLLKDDKEDECMES